MENCVSICSNRVSKPATFEAVSDSLDIEVSSGFGLKKGAKETDGVGVDAIVVGVPVDFFFFFLF